MSTISTKEGTNIMLITPLETGAQIGGGAGYVADLVAAGIADARIALELAATDWDNVPHIGPHPREAAIAAAREAAAHLTEALGIEAPQDAVDATRHALEELGAAVLVLERMRGVPPFAPVTKPTGHFEGALRLLEQVETELRHGTVGFG